MMPSPSILFEMFRLDAAKPGHPQPKLRSSTEAAVPNSCTRQTDPGLFFHARPPAMNAGQSFQCFPFKHNLFFGRAQTRPRISERAATSGCTAKPGASRNSRPDWRPRFRRLCPPHASINHTASRRALIKVNRGPRTPFCAAVRPSLSLSGSCSCSCSKT